MSRSRVGGLVKPKQEVTISFRGTGRERVTAYSFFNSTYTSIKCGYRKTGFMYLKRGEILELNEKFLIAHSTANFISILGETNASAFCFVYIDSDL